MKKLLVTFMILVVVVGVVGFARGWFSISSESMENHTAVQLRIDKDKVHADEEKVKQELHAIQDKLSSQPDSTNSN